jgi:hypothetical protein
VLTRDFLYSKMTFLSDAPLAQLDRALDYESSGQRFESSRARHFTFYPSNGCGAAPGRFTPDRASGYGWVVDFLDRAVVFFGISSVSSRSEN